MSTPKQEKLAEAIIENLKADKPKTREELAVSSGYALSTAEGGVKDIIEQKGVQDALEARGFTLENAKKVVSEIMLSDEAKDRDRLTAADMTIKVHGGYAPERKVNLNFSVDAKDFEQFDEMSRKYDEEMKRKMLE